ncbi:MAG: sigma-E factor negative regulatory protein [Pseudomonadota bacterium]|nr:sigma-E factor negative regulatory protein [Pseudomonadota bacterium]
MTKATFKRMAQTEQTAQAESAERFCEYLSAVMDGEADDLTLRRLAQESATYPELSDKWERYHLARDLIHGRGIPVSSGFSERVAAAVDAETVPHVPSLTRSGLAQQLIKFAVAATVAVVAAITLQSEMNEPELPAASLSASQTSRQPDAETPGQVFVAGSELVVSPAPVDPEAQRRLKVYIESMSFDSDETVRSEHIPISPLYRLVNQLESENP